MRDVLRGGRYEKRIVSLDPVEGVLRSAKERGVLQSLEPHKHVVRLAGAAADPGRLLLEQVAGASLDGYLRDASSPLSVSEAYGVYSQLLAAVEHCHAHGIIHRDIKPSNILFTEDGELRLIDFDVAAYRGARSTLPGYEDVRIGTLPYSAPEQIMDPAAATYETADIFSLGVVLYEMLTGRIPFPMTDDESEEEYRARLPYEDPVPPRTYRPDLPAEIEAVILKAMARDPAARHQSVAELREELEATLRAADPPPLPAALLPRAQIFAWAGLGMALATLLAWIFAGA